MLHIQESGTRCRIVVFTPLSRSLNSDEITVTLGPSGSVISLTYEPLVSPLAPSCAQLIQDTSPTRESFDSKISYATSTPGMVLPVIFPNTKPPGGLKFFPRSSKDAVDPNIVEPEAPQGFLRRYWYIFAAFFAMQLMQSGGGEAAQQDQTTGAGTPQADGAAGGEAAPAPSGSGAGVRRRGKRG